MVLRQRNEEVQTLAAEASEETLAYRVRGWRPDRRAENPDTHRGHGGVQPRRVDTVAIVENEPVGVGFFRVT